MNDCTFAPLPGGVANATAGADVYPAPTLVMFTLVITPPVTVAVAVAGVAGFADVKTTGVAAE